MEKKKAKKVVKEERSHAVGGTEKCGDKLCPVHGKNKLKTRGRVFEGVVVRRFPQRITVQFERMIKVPKYERYEKRKTKIHARLPGCLNAEIGDLVRISETRPISKTIHFVAREILKKFNGENSNETNK